MPKVTQLLDGRPRTKTPFFAPSTSLLFSLPFHIQHDNDHNSLPCILVPVPAVPKPRDWKKKN